LVADIVDGAYEVEVRLVANEDGGGDGRVMVDEERGRRFSYSYGEQRPW
jgi:hypothetical protein